MSAARRRLRAAVIGVGRMGLNHARVAAELPGIDLVGVADLSEDAVREVGRRHNVSAYLSTDELLAREHPDLVVVAVPTERHLEVAAAALRAGAHVLVEKPIAGDLASARRMIRIALEHRRLLFVGYVERFNPAVGELARRLDRGDAGRILQVHTQRFSPPVHIRDSGVLVDLGTHDLDLMRFLLHDEPVRVWAEVRRRSRPDHEDLVVATLLFPRGVIGLLEVNWLTPVKVRKMSVLGERGLFTVDYITQELVFYESELVMGRWAVRDLASGGGTGRIVRIPIAHAEPLRLEWEAFIRAARGRPGAAVTGSEALRTSELAAAVARSAERSAPVLIRRAVR